MRACPRGQVEEAQQDWDVWVGFGCLTAVLEDGSRFWDCVALVFGLWLGLMERALGRLWAQEARHKLW